VKRDNRYRRLSSRRVSKERRRHLAPPPFLPSKPPSIPPKSGRRRSPLRGEGRGSSCSPENSLSLSSSRLCSPRSRSHSRPVFSLSFPLRFRITLVFPSSERNPLADSVWSFSYFPSLSQLLIFVQPPPPPPPASSSFKLLLLELLQPALNPRSSHRSLLLLLGSSSSSSPTFFSAYSRRSNQDG